MKYTGLIRKAIAFAVKTHQVDRDQKRKGKNVPYITHPLTVALILSQAGADEDTIAAGILHDTIEDSAPENKVTKEMIEKEFRPEVAAMVANVTEFNKELPWVERKAAALEHIKGMDHNSLLVKSADIISNVSEIVDDCREADSTTVFARFNQGDKVVENYLKVISALQSAWPESPLATDLAEVKIQLARIGTLMEGPLPYVDWCFSFIEYEMNRVYQGSKVKDEVLELCRWAHSAISDYEGHQMAPLLDMHLSCVLSEFRLMISALDGDESEVGTRMLLMCYLADSMTMLGKFAAMNSQSNESLSDNLPGKVRGVNPSSAL